MKAGYHFAGCTTINCPRYRDIDAPVEMPKSQLLQDKRGNYWCTECRKRYELMDWGNEHHWPEVRATGQRGTYATLDDYADWFANVALGTQDLVDAMYTTLIDTGQQEA